LHGLLANVARRESQAWQDPLESAAHKESRVRQEHQESAVHKGSQAQPGPQASAAQLGRREPRESPVCRDLLAQMASRAPRALPERGVHRASPDLQEWQEQ
jgi:hypothetical protein